MFKEYGELSTMLYHHTKPIGRSVGGDIEFYADSLKGVTGGVLEAGVGTGRVLIPLIQQGFDVDGVDLSAEMLAQCKANLDKHGVTAGLFQQDLTTLDLPRKYGAIIMPTGSFCLLPRSLVNKVLNSFFHHLEPGGKVLIDIIMPTDFTVGETSQYATQLTDGTGILFTSYSQSIDWHGQKVSYTHRYELLKSGQVEQTEISRFIVHWYGIQEFEMLLKAAGFADISHVIGYGSAQSPITFTAIKDDLKQI